MCICWGGLYGFVDGVSGWGGRLSEGLVAERYGVRVSVRVGSLWLGL